MHPALAEAAEHEQTTRPCAVRGHWDAIPTRNPCIVREAR
jgi:hypothetical protein